MTAHELTLGITLTASRAGSMSAHVAPSLFASEYCFVLQAVTQAGDVAPASAEFGSTMSDDSSIASNALAGIVFSSAIICGYGPVSQPASSVPWKNQLEPLSATMRP